MKSPHVVAFLALALLIGSGWAQEISPAPSSEEEQEFLHRLQNAPRWVIGPAIALGTLTSEDLACVTAGILSSQGALSYLGAVFWCWTGILGGDLGLYALGRCFGRRAAEWKALHFVLSPERLQRGEDLFARKGAWILFTSRFLPGTRVPIFVAAGTVRYSLWKFGLFLALAGLVWVPLIVSFARWSGGQVLDWLDVYERYAWVGLIGVVLAIWLIVEWITPLFSYRGRRLVLSRWHRFWEWEFWPMPVVYLPVVLYLFWLGLRHRNLLAFTAVNPGMPHGGIAEESKSEILHQLTGETGQDSRVAEWRVLDPEDSLEERLKIIETFRLTRGLDFPLVLKPDIGERGEGVAIVRSNDEATRYLEACESRVIVQEFVGGEEFGIFYIRHPEADRGQIFSITQKHLVHVTGDGKRNLEHLILSDPRGLRMARWFLRHHENRLDWVPDNGETVALGEVGSHCRGAIFLDARGFATPELTAAVDDLCHRYDGFFFGRFDVKVPDSQALREGRDWKAIELNGVTAEATHIYQPKYPLLQGWKDLCEQWRFAYEIGAFHAANGHAPSQFSEVWQVIRTSLTRHKFEAPPRPEPDPESTG